MITAGRPIRLVSGPEKDGLRVVGSMSETVESMAGIYRGTGEGVVVVLRYSGWREGWMDGRE